MVLEGCRIIAQDMDMGYKGTMIYRGSKINKKHCIIGGKGNDGKN